MSDSGSSQSGVGEAVKTVNEAVVQPIKNEAQQALEEGVSAITGRQLTPQQIQQRQQDKFKKEAEGKRQQEYWRGIISAQQAVRQKEQQDKSQTQQIKKQEVNVKQFEIREKKKQDSEEVKRSRAEVRAGKGVGG